MSRVNGEQQAGPHDTAISKKKPFPRIFEGKLVSIIGNKLVMTNQEGRECSHTLAADVKLSLDGTVCKAEDMKGGSKIRVTTKQNDPKAAIDVASLRKSGDFAKINWERRRP